MPIKGTPSYYANALAQKRGVVLYTNGATYDLMKDLSINDYSATDQFTTFCGNIIKLGGWKIDPSPGWAVPTEPPPPPKK